MAQSFLEITTNLVISHIQAGLISPEETSAALRATYQWIVSLQVNAANEDSRLARARFNQ